MSYDQDVPESLFGALMAIEGVTNSMTLLNGPTGCKYCPSARSEDYFDRGEVYNPYVFFKEFFFSQPRIPCTYLDGNDLIMGTNDKLSKLISVAESSKPELIGIVNSPGASLIGSILDLKQNEDIPIVTCESPGYSDSFEKGFEDTVIKILDTVVGKRKTMRRMTVNLIGISIRELNWKDSVLELTKLLNACGIEVITVAGAGWSIEEMRESVNAAANVIIFENLGTRIAKWYSDRCYIPTVNPPCGVPLGFDQTESWIRIVCGSLRCDPTPALMMISSARRRVASEINRFNNRTGLPAGCTFSISGSGPLVYSVIITLHSYLGMIPVAIETTDDSADEKIQTYLAFNEIEVTDDVFNTPADIYLGSGTMIASLMLRNVIGNGVNIESPASKTVNISYEPIFGVYGTMNLIDRVLNSLERSL